MTPPTPSPPGNDGTPYGPPRHSSKPSLRVSVAIIIATAILAIGSVYGSGRPAWGDDEGQSRPAPTEPGQASFQTFISGIRHSLKHNDDRLIDLAEQVLETVEDRDRPQEPVAALELRVRAAEARYRAAKLDREIAQSQLEEFQKVTLVREMADAESQIAAAKEDLERARKAGPVAEERLARIRALLKKESALSLRLEDKYGASVFLPKIEEQRATFTLEAAESRKKVLLEYTKRSRTQRLQSAIEMATSDELAKRAIWDLEKLKLNKTKRMPERPKLSDVQVRILALVQQAYPIEEEIEEMLTRLVARGKAEDTLQSALRDLSNQLDSLVARAEGESAAARFDGLKSRLGRAANPSMLKRLFGN